MNGYRCLETHILHASDVIYWLDGSTAVDEEEMARLTAPLTLELTTRPRDLMVAHRTGKTAVWRRFSGAMISGSPAEADKEYPTTSTPFTVAGTARDLAGRYNPRAFSLTAGLSGAREPAWYPNGHAVVLYPSPLGIRMGTAGGLVGTLRWADAENVAPWALLTLDVSVGLADVRSFRAQANRHGDFMLSLSQLPPLSQSITYYQATLTISASTESAPEIPADPETFESMTLGALGSADTFSADISLQVVPGETQLVRSFEKDHLTVKPGSP